MEANQDVRRFVDAVTPERRRRDAETPLGLMQRATGQPPRWRARPSATAATSSGVGCVYVKNLHEVDLAVLDRIVARSYRTLTSGTLRDGSSLASSGTAYGLRAREGKQ